MSGLWAVWMKVWCWGVLGFGVLLVTAAVPPLDGLIRTLFALFSTDPANPAAFDLQAVRFGLGLQGALTIGWALTMMALVRAAETLGAPVWRALTFALLIWYAIDSAISVATGMGFNAISNTLLVIAYLVPVLASGALKAEAAR
jgi:hypothetical protein